MSISFSKKDITAVPSSCIIIETDHKGYVGSKFGTIVQLPGTLASINYRSKGCVRDTLKLKMKKIGKQLELGQIVNTRISNLLCHWALYVVTRSSNQKIDEKYLRKILLEITNICIAMDYTSIVMPLLGVETGCLNETISREVHKGVFSDLEDIHATIILPKECNAIKIIYKYAFKEISNLLSDKENHMNGRQQR